MDPAHRLLGLRFICPRCHQELEGTGTRDRTCRSCGRMWELSDGKWRFGGEKEIVAHEPTDAFKSIMKAYPRFYTAATNILGPVYPHWYFESRRLRKRLREGDVVVDIGSGNYRFSDAVVNVDLMPYPNVDVVTSADGLPFADESVDVLISIAVLEHVPDPTAVIAECARILKVNGTAYIYVPFIQGFHAAPHDYQRLTLPGLKLAMGAFLIERTENFGPTSGLVWVLGDWLSIALSFGSSHLQRTLALVFTAMLSPLKFLDVALRHFPGAETISTGFLVVARKPAPILSIPDEDAVES